MSVGMIRLIKWSIIGLLVFYLFTDPTGLAAAIHGAALGVAGLFQGIITFLSALFAQFGIS